MADVRNGVQEEKVVVDGDGWVGCARGGAGCIARDRCELQHRYAQELAAVQSGQVVQSGQAVTGAADRDAAYAAVLGLVDGGAGGGGGGSGGGSGGSSGGGGWSGRRWFSGVWGGGGAVVQRTLVDVAPGRGAALQQLYMRHVIPGVRRAAGPALLQWHIAWRPDLSQLLSLSVWPNHAALLQTMRLNSGMLHALVGSCLAVHMLTALAARGAVSAAADCRTRYQQAIALDCSYPL
jgi:hypothetical protein